jgi:PAS domain S-box-containing protein
MNRPTVEPTPAAVRDPDQRLFAAPVILLAVLVGMTAFLAISHTVLLRENQRWVSHTHEVIEATQRAFSYAQDVESGARGYIGGGDPIFLGHYNASRAAFPAAAARLQALVSDNPDQRARVALFDSLLQRRIDLADQRVNLARQARFADAKSPSGPTGIEAMEQARGVMGEILRTEDSLLAVRSARTERNDAIVFIVSLSIIALAFLGLAVALAAMRQANQRMAREIGERQAAEAALRESQALYRAVFSQSVDYLFVVDVAPDGRLIASEMNPAFEKATGWRTADYRGVDIGDRSNPMTQRLAERFRRVLDQEKPLFMRERVTLQGGVRTWETVLTAIRNEEGRVERILGASRDVTEREEAEDRLRRAQRMEAVGHLTGGVAHDFNNLLQVIRGNLELLTPMIEGEAALQRLKNALRGADRAAQLTRQLLAYARRQPLEPKVVNLGRLVTEMTDMLRRTLGEAVDVETVIAGGLWNTLADPAQVESAILNLAINARDAMPSGGKLTVEITNAFLDQTYASRDEEIEAGQYVLLAVSDTGIGMSKQVRDRVFEPFFTTKGEEKGTGLGLSMVYGFVKQSKGHVQIYSEVGQGTTVKIYLPRALQAEEEGPKVEKGALRGASEVILVVEDDDMVRSSTVGILRDLGYVCLHAADGAAALEIVKSGARVDLLFTDVIMPGPVKSRDLANQARAMRPDLPVLFTSGYTENAIVHQGRLDEGVQLLSKPYTRDELARRIGALLHAARRVVLVVEDDGLVRMSAVDMVESLGFSALAAADSEAALAVLRGPARVDVLFTDVGLPGMRGPELARKAAGLRPDLKIIFASGYGETEESSGFEGAAHLGKPYEQEQLAEILATAVA